MTAPVGPLYVADPPLQYLVLPPLVLDCSTLAGMLFFEAWHEQASDRIRGKVLHAPSLLPFEITSVAAKKHRMGRPDIAADGLLQFAAMDIELHDIEPAVVLGLAVRYGLSTYDAAYLWLAAELKAPLATFDEKLATAAKTHLASLS